MLVSHDRDFLDRVATSIVLAEGDGRFTEYAGGYSDMLAQRGGKPARDAASAQGGAQGAGAKSGARAGAPKMNFADAHALKTLPEKIAAAELKMAELEQTCPTAIFMPAIPAKFAELSAELAELRTAKGRRRGTLAGAGDGTRSAGTGRRT